MSEIDEKPLPMPKFATEREEADWWYSQRDVLSERFLARAKAGTLTSGRAARQIAELRAKRAAKAANVSVELDPTDAQKASELAARRGVEYQAFVRQLVHEALERESTVTS
jgi:hypothetical protein